MVICGVDYSISSPACVKAKLNKNLEITAIDYVSFSSTKKTCKSDERIFHNQKKDFRNDLDRFYFLRDTVDNFMYSTFDNGFHETPEYVAIEGYAMGGMGKVFNIAEATVLTKSMIYNKGSNIRIYTPSAIKKFATGNGSAGKVSMWEKFNDVDDKLLDLSHLTDLKNPQEDIIDAYWIMKLLQTELQLRYGMIQLKDLDHKKIEVFNAVSKSNPQNVLVRDFIYNV